MLNPANDAVRRVRNFQFFKSSHELTGEDVEAARKYIKQYWEKLQRHCPTDEDTLIGLPKPYLVPSYEEGTEFDYNEMYYWDSYFMVQGMMDLDHKKLVMGILENLVYMFKRYKIIPNASRTFLMGRSQSPLLSSLIWEAYEAYQPGKEWLGENITVAIQEYETVWMGTTKPNARQVHKGLSRYYDINYQHNLAEAESGWDMTPRFNHKCLDYLPVDLNALLYKYEMDFARYYHLIDDAGQAAKWEAAAATRAETMNKLMWSDLRDLYYDYNYVKKKRGIVSSLAAYYPLWAGMVDEKKAAELVRSLRRFENRGGLATTDVQPLNQYVRGMVPTQWAFPNGWAPLHLLVVKGLQRYGYHEDARRIAMKWLTTNLNWFNREGVFLEKYNVIQPDKPPMKGLYPSQSGFGWTNAVFERFCQEFIDGKS